MFSWAAVGSVADSVKTIFAGKYYVEQQLAKMQVHRLHKKQLIEKATKPRSRELIESIFDEYDNQIQSTKWRWIKKGDKLHCYRKEDVKDKTCNSSFHDGIFPPIAAIAATMKNCKDVIPHEEVNVNDVTATLQAWGTTYTNLEYWVLQLEALEQDMAVTMRI